MVNSNKLKSGCSDAKKKKKNALEKLILSRLDLWEREISNFFHQNTKLNTLIETFSGTEQEKYYNYIIIFNI